MRMTSTYTQMVLRPVLMQWTTRPSEIRPEMMSRGNIRLVLGTQFAESSRRRGMRRDRAPESSGSSRKRSPRGPRRRCRTALSTRSVTAMFVLVRQRRLQIDHPVAGIPGGVRGVEVVRAHVVPGGADLPARLPGRGYGEIECTLRGAVSMSLPSTMVSPPSTARENAYSCRATVPDNDSRTVRDPDGQHVAQVTRYSMPGGACAPLPTLKPFDSRRMTSRLLHGEQREVDFTLGRVAGIFQPSSTESSCSLSRSATVC